MKLIFSLLLLSLTYYSKGQITDSTLTELFGGYHPQEIRAFINQEKLTNDKLKDYVTALSFKIPMLNPVSNQKITSSFGYRIHPVTGELRKHQGTDIKAQRGQNIYAAADGEVMEVGYNNLLGNYLKIKHLLGFVSLYGHLQAIHVIPNEIIYQGQMIGSCGDSGRTTGVHLHFSILWRGQYLNPYDFIF